MLGRSRVGKGHVHFPRRRGSGPLPPRGTPRATWAAAGRRRPSRQRRRRLRPRRRGRRRGCTTPSPVPRRSHRPRSLLCCRCGSHRGRSPPPVGAGFGPPGSRALPAPAGPHGWPTARTGPASALTAARCSRPDGPGRRGRRCPRPPSATGRGPRLGSVPSAL